MKNNTTEVVIYQVKQDKLADYPTISMMIDNFLRNRQGFISRRVTQDSHNDAIFLNIIEWASLKEASEAAEAIQKDPAMAPLFSSTELISFGHYHNFG